MYQLHQQNHVHLNLYFRFHHGFGTEIKPLLKMSYLLSFTKLWYIQFLTWSCNNPEIRITIVSYKWQNHFGDIKDVKRTRSNKWRTAISEERPELNPDPAGPNWTLTLRPGWPTSYKGPGSKYFRLCGLHWGKNWGYYVGTYITRKKIDFHKLFIDKSQNVIILTRYNFFLQSKSANKKHWMPKFGFYIISTYSKILFLFWFF